ncbi:hypothetical protein DNTS_007691 [Danionella cerebrum]|uniref:Uncharacterized protein n=1 Tax=Danionella cerebrum TaxID=2873325 RepID=A0A553QRM8_9TELE|nr:hypothetical protein DNTS_007691 [Danionella translucida]
MRSKWEGGEERLLAHPTVSSGEGEKDKEGLSFLQPPPLEASREGKRRKGQESERGSRGEFEVGRPAERPPIRAKNCPWMGGLLLSCLPFLQKRIERGALTAKEKRGEQGLAQGLEMRVEEQEFQEERPGQIRVPHVSEKAVAFLYRCTTAVLKTCCSSLLITLINSNNKYTAENTAIEHGGAAGSTVAFPVAGSRLTEELDSQLMEIDIRRESAVKRSGGNPPALPWHHGAFPEPFDSFPREKTRLVEGTALEPKHIHLQQTAIKL